MNNIMQLPEQYQQNIRKAIHILKDGGCTDVFLFGSLITNSIHPDSDIDLAVKGCPKGKFFRLLGTLLRELDYPVDLVDLENQDAFAQYLQQTGDLVHLG